MLKPMTTQLKAQIEQYRHWREELIQAITAYASWLEQSDNQDASQSLRLSELLESLKRDQMTLAFVAEFSRGKTELINALFFSDFNQRLLPSDVGRTTMCPTEIFSEPDQPPYIRLLPIETRARDDSIGALKKLSKEWNRIKLDLSLPDEMLAAMQRLTETKMVTPEAAKKLGLWSDDPALMNMIDQNGKIEVPSWRYAQINYPHPLLDSGLVILDTPGLNALGTEPELTLNIIPNAHAVLFLLATDTGVTQSDMVIWRQFVEPHAQRRVAVLNKIDTVWDDLKSQKQIEDSIQRQLEKTASQLSLAPESVITISAQKALLAKIRNDTALLKKSGIEKLESLFADDFIPGKQAIVCNSVLKEISDMVGSSRQQIENQLLSSRHELSELVSLTGKNRGVIEMLREKILEDKKQYDTSVQNFNLTKQALSQQGNAMLANLDQHWLEETLDKSRQSIQDRWTTTGLMRGMQSLLAMLMSQFESTLESSMHIQRLLDTAYTRFYKKHQLKRVSPPALNLEIHHAKLTELIQSTSAFCNDPVNVMTEKHFLIKKFYLALVGQAEDVFILARYDAGNWLKSALNPLFSEIKEYKVHLQKRLDNVKKIHENVDTLKQRISDQQNTIKQLEDQVAFLDNIMNQLSRPQGEIPSKAKEHNTALLH